MYPFYSGLEGSHCPESANRLWAQRVVIDRGGVTTEKADFGLVLILEEFRRDFGFGQRSLRKSSAKQNGGEVFIPEIKQLQLDHLEI